MKAIIIIHVAVEPTHLIVAINCTGSLQGTRRQVLESTFDLGTLGLIITRTARRRIIVTHHLPRQGPIIEAVIQGIIRAQEEDRRLRRIIIVPPLVPPEEVLYLMMKWIEGDGIKKLEFVYHTHTHTHSFFFLL